jgi:hypothetical protein
MKKSDVEREIKTMTENRMSKYKTTILQVSVHREESNPVFGEGNTYVSVDDEAAGPFLIIEQSDDNIETGKVRMDYEEFLAVAEAAKMLMHQMYIEQANQEANAK